MGIEPTNVFVERKLSTIDSALIFAVTNLKLGTVDGNQTRRILIDSQLSPSGDLYGIKLGGVGGIRTTHKNFYRVRALVLRKQSFRQD